MTADVPMSEPVPEGATERLKLTLAEHIDSGASGDPACTCIEFDADGYVIEDSTALDCPRHGVTLAERHRVRDLDAEVARLRRCGATHPTNATVVPCVLDRGVHYDGLHWSSTGCAGSAISWPTAEAENARLREDAAWDAERLVEASLAGSDTLRALASTMGPERGRVILSWANEQGAREKAEAEVARLRGVVTRVEALHVRLEGVTVAGWCRGDGRKWPCPTARALTEPADSKGDE